MAKTISDEELQLKKRARRRLIGAIALVALIAVVLPMLLDNEPRPLNQDVDIRIPSPQQPGAFPSKVTPATPPAADKPAAGAVSGKAGSAPPVDTASPSKAGAQSAAAPRAETISPARQRTEQKPPAAKPATASPRGGTRAKPKPGKFVVQVAALTDAARARALQEKISAEGIAAYTEVVKTAKGDVTRVRIGPFATRDAAEATRNKLKAIGLGGNITSK